MDDKPQRAECHSRGVAGEYVAPGWSVTHEFRERDAEQPDETLVARPRPGEVEGGGRQNT